MIGDYAGTAAGVADILKENWKTGKHSETGEVTRNPFRNSASLELKAETSAEGTQRAQQVDPSTAIHPVNRPLRSSSAHGTTQRIASERTAADPFNRPAQCRYLPGYGRLAHPQPARQLLGGLYAVCHQPETQGFGRCR